MKTILLSLLSMPCLAVMGAATEPTVSMGSLAQDQIEILVSPIALYPDALVALILPASTRPSDIVLAARFLDGDDDIDAAAGENWESSVRALVRYPEVVTYLDENLAWTQSLGDVFLAQPADVMNAIQTVRARARAKGLLVDTEEQEVIVEDGEIRIVPAQATVIYVPHYDPEVLYVTYERPYYPGPFLSFGIGYSIGAWLSYDCDWGYRTVYIAHRAPDWHYNYNWRARPDYRYSTGRSGRAWAPASHYVRNLNHSLGAPTITVLNPHRNRVSSGHTRLEAPERNRSRSVSPLPDIQRIDTSTRSKLAGNGTPSKSRPAMTDNRHLRPVRATTVAPVHAASSKPVSSPPIAQRDTYGKNSRRSSDETPRWQRSGSAFGERSSAPVPESRVRPSHSPAARKTEGSAASSRAGRWEKNGAREHRSGDRDAQSDIQ